jgi:predicted ATPase/class 3 adenylate cyclase/Tfp pilus assembly protein PilF
LPRGSKAILDACPATFRADNPAQYRPERSIATVVQTPPVGTVTLLSTDIEGSTVAWERLGPAFASSVEAHFRILFDAVARHHGFPVRTEGDSLLAAFARVSDALQCAAEAQQALAAYPWSPEVGAIRVRAGLHTGEPRLCDGQYDGPPVHRATRIQAAAHGGQVLLSATACELAREEIGEGLAARALGRYRLKDLAEPELLYELQYPGMPEALPPPRTLEFLPNNLPSHWTSFIGREREIAEVKGTLAGTRLLTLTGAGGCGKTRLALQVAADLLGDYPDGVWLVELAAVADPALVPQAVAAAVGVREEPGRPLLQTLVESLRPRRLLLLLDNCEHLVGACASLAHDLLSRCPQLCLLATSREVLGIAGEMAWRVPSLSLPDPEEPLPAEQITDYEAVRLFVDRALRTRPGFAVTPENASSVAQVCHRLDGIPLAIELAAARVCILSVEQITARLDDCFHLLSGGNREALPRQQTLRAAIDWSYDLLSEAERQLLRRLSVFAGGWTLPAAESVCAGEEIEEHEVLDLLTALVDKSLVSVDEQGNEARYRLLETIRQYGAEQLRGSGEEAPLRQRHRNWFRELAETAEAALSGADQGTWLNRLEREHANVRAALDAAVQAADVETAWRLGGALWRFWEVRGYLAEGRQRLAAVLGAEPGAPSRGEATLARAKALAGAGVLAQRQGDYGMARALYEESLAIRRELGDHEGIAGSLNHLGSIAVSQGDYSTARTLFEESLAIWRERRNRQGIAASLHSLGIVAQFQGDYDTARARYRESLALRREIEDNRGIAAALNNLGNIAWYQGEHAAARSLYEEGLAIRRGLGDKAGIAHSLNNVGMVAQFQGDYDAAQVRYHESLVIRRELGDQAGIAASLNNLGNVAYYRRDYGAARTLWEESLTIKRALGDKDGIAGSLNNLGIAAQHLGDTPAARALHAESLVLRQQLGDKAGIAECLEGLAGVAGTQGQPELAARLFGAAEALREAIGAPLSPADRDEHERLVAPARAGLAPDEFAAAWAAGREMPLEQALLCAAGEPGDP